MLLQPSEQEHIAFWQATTSTRASEDAASTSYAAQAKRQDGAKALLLRSFLNSHLKNPVFVLQSYSYLQKIYCISSELAMSLPSSPRMAKILSMPSASIILSLTIFRARKRRTFALALEIPSVSVTWSRVMCSNSESRYTSLKLIGNSSTT